MYVQRNTEERSRTTVAARVAFVIQQSALGSIILTSAACPALPLFDIAS